MPVCVDIYLPLNERRVELKKEAILLKTRIIGPEIVSSFSTGRYNYLRPEIIIFLHHRGYYLQGPCIFR